jgi:translocator protein
MHSCLTRLESGKERNYAIIAFLLQLVLNFGWSFLFFYFKMIGFALVESVTLWIAIVTMLYLFYKIKPIAAYINIPYFLWVTFASILNSAYFIPN